jgi:hypothetical protein
MINNPETKSDVDAILKLFSNEFGGVTPANYIKERPDGQFLIFEVAQPTSRIYEISGHVNEAISESNIFRNRINVAQRRSRPSNVLDIPETILLQKELSASLTVDRNTFGENFLERYMPSVTNLERQIVVQANHMVYGRRGSGKSSLLAYAMHDLRLQKQAYAWIAVQTYRGRTDPQAIASVLGEIFTQVAQFSSTPAEFDSIASELNELGELDSDASVEKKISRLTPRLRRTLGSMTNADQHLTIFLDDLHVLGGAIQAKLLSSIYSLSRGNRIYIKVSGIEQLTNLWDGKTRHGLESPHDVQILKLDHNLTTPDQSKEHIRSILDRHARYCGLPDIQYLAGEDFINRLVLAAAAVPRDALSLFSQSISRSYIRKQKSVSITSLNGATAEAIEEKLKDMQSDIASGDEVEIANKLDDVKHFCLDVQKSNAFLVKIQNSKTTYKYIQKLVALRLIHILHEGITPHTAGERFIALMLDYGFYIGIRAARSIKLFPAEPKALAAKELRKLPILTK